MPFRIRDLTPDSIADAHAFWLYGEDEAWERWRLVPESAVVSPNGNALRLTFELDGDVFDWALVEREGNFLARHDDHAEPAQELPARVYAGDDEVIVRFEHDDQIVFVELELEIELD